MEGQVKRIDVTLVPMVRSRRRGWWPLAVTAALAIFVAWLMYRVWRSPRSTDLATYGAFALPVAVLVAGWVTWAWRKATTSPDDNVPDGEKLDRAADRLATAVQSQWQGAATERGLAGADPIQVAWGRPSAPMVGPLAAAVGSRRFDPLPGLAPVAESQLVAGRISDLHAVYGGLGSGRLVIAGSPGSGKSGTAVLLILTALRHRERVPSHDKPKVPVPVLVTAQDWDPRHQSVADWLTRQLQETYPLFTGTAGALTAVALINEGKIAVILDGLDEISADLRPAVLQALSQQASFRIVVLSRTIEMTSAASDHGVLMGAAAIELRTLDPAEAVNYLERVQLDPPPVAWRDLIEHVRNNPASPLSKALDNPLALTLVRDTYQFGDDVRELLEFCDDTLGMSGDLATEAITGHLLDRVLPAAYTCRPGQPPLPYDLQTARNALTKIAAHMNQESTRDLRWWNIPDWISPTPRRMVGLVVGLVAGLVIGLAAGLSDGLRSGLEAGLSSGFLIGCEAWISSTSEYPGNMGRFRVKTLLKWGTLKYVLMIGIPSGIASGTVTAIAFGIDAGIVAGIVIGLAAGLAAGVAVTFEDNSESTSALSPATSRRADQKYGLVVGLLGGLGVGLMIGFILGIFFGLTAGLAAGLAAGLGIQLLSSQVWPVSLAGAQLAVKWHTPMRLMRFLDDAHHRNVLRTVGPIYQFRHARLQDRLAPATARNDEKPAAPADCQ
jgi:hypothetical protein